MVALRTRTKSYGDYPNGSLRRNYWYGPNDWDMHYSAPIQRGWETIVDDTDASYGEGSYLRIHKLEKELAYPTFIPQEPLATIVDYQQWLPQWFRDWSPEFGLTGDLPTLDQVAVETMAKTNPSAPVADVPVAILELGDIVKLIKDVGSDLLKRKLKGKSLKPTYDGFGKSASDTYADAARTNLSYQFGIAPMISDVSDILLFTEHVAKRVKYLTELRDKGGKSKTFRKNKPYTVEWSAASPASGMMLNSAGLQVYASTITDYVKEERWGIAKWVPDSEHSFPRDNESMRRLARDAVYGNTLDLSTAWELIPWSWLIDYGFEIGAYFAAHRNIVPAKCEHVSVCTRQVVEHRFDPYQYYNMVFGRSTLRKITKLREPIRLITPAAHLPMLNYGQMSIIASLGVLKGR